MKKIFFTLLLMTCCISLFADTTINNGVTRIREGRYTKVVNPDSFKPQNSKFSSVINQVDIYLDYYIQADKEQYAIVMDYMGALLDFPGILPNGCTMRITTENGQEMSINSIFVQNETVTHLGQTGVCVGGYFPLSKQQIDNICLGVSSTSFDIIISDKTNAFNDKSTIKGNKFSKEINGFYKAIQKEKSKLNIPANKSELEDSNILLLYYGYNYNPFLYGEFLKSSNLNHDESTWESFLSNQDKINSQYNSYLLNVVMKNARPNEFANSLAGTINSITNGVQDGVKMYAQAKQMEGARKAAEEEAKRQQEKARMEAHWAEQRAQAKAKEEAKEKAEIDKLFGGSSSLTAQMQAEKAKSTTRQMETSDLAQYQALRMSDTFYGKEATDRMLAEKAKYEAEQNQQFYIDRNRESDQNLGVTENAVTSSGASIQIKVRNGIVTAYSTENNYAMTGPEWVRIEIPVRINTLKKCYEADLGAKGVVYWGTNTEQEISFSETTTTFSNTSEIEAVTTSGDQVILKVKRSRRETANVLDVAVSVLEYKLNGNHWERAGKQTPEKTNVSFDGEQIATRFEYKIEIPGIGPVYF